MRIIIIYISLQEVVKANYKFFEVDYYGADNDNYVAGEGFCCGDNNLKTKSIADDSPNYEKLQYYYHSDHLGSASYITNLDGEVVQHIEYVPFGEVFLEERNNTWNTPFLFNGKELDEETGLYYYGSRYYNPRISLWYGVDPLILTEDYWGTSLKDLRNGGVFNSMNLGVYNYTYNNPVKYNDPDGRSPIIPILYAIFEVGMSAYDVYDTVNTLFFDDNATNFEKTITTAGFAAGLLSFGGGYGKAGRESALLLLEQTTKRSGNLRAALGVTKANAHLYKGFQAHHLIPVDLLKKNKVVKDAVLAGFDFNGKTNGLLVKAGKGKHTRHDGYTTAIEKEINKFLKDNPKYKPEQAKEFLEDLASRARETIKKNNSVNNTIKID